MANRRLLSLDVLRGLTVIGMVLVNSAAVFHYGKNVPVYDTLLHADWHGITLADVVFPFFIFMVGVSIPFALSGVKEREGLTTATATAMRILKRGALLFLIGLILTLTLMDWSGPVRVLGVLQRIGLTFVFASLLFMTLSWRSLALIALATLLLYDPATLIPIPDAATDYLAPGQNFSSWLDRALLGNHVYNPSAPLPFEPEGLLGTLPSTAQALIGILAGLWLKQQGVTQESLGPLSVAGVALLGIGYTWALLFPPVKAIWSSAFVWITSGYGLLLLAFLAWILDIRRIKVPLTSCAQAFGINAITAYVVHTYLLGLMLYSTWNWTLYETLLSVLPAKMAALPSFLLVILASWLPVAIMKRRGIILKV